MVFVRMYQRVSQSYEVALEQYQDRVAAGLQPSTRVVNLYSVGTEEGLLVCANFLYLGLVVLLYLRMLRRKEPVRLRALMLGYNTLNVCISLFVACSLLFFKVSSRGFNGGGRDGSVVSPGGVRGVGGFVCNPLRTDLQGQMVARVFAVFYLQKYLELVDTFLFLLRRSFRQVTFFHLFHHCSITVIVGSILPFDFNGDMYLPIMLNSIVHVLVYLHYVLSALGKHSWWSRHLTKLQLTQFAVILVQSATAFYRGPDCGSPDFVKVVLLLYMISLLGLFALFFVKRSLLGPAEDPGMCGVIKSLEADRGGGIGGTAGKTEGVVAAPAAAAAAGSWHGNVLLDEVGAAEIWLPPGFPAETLAGSTTYSYQLTPVGAPMPGLFVSEEIATATSRGSKPIGRLRGDSNDADSCISFSVKGGKPRFTVSWAVTAVGAPCGGGGGGTGGKQPPSPSHKSSE